MTTNNAPSNNGEHNSYALRLHNLISFLEPGQREFATSLCNWVLGSEKAPNGRSWSEKQFYWVKKLIADAESAMDRKEKERREMPARKFPNLAKLFSSEKIAKLAWPSIKYKLTEDGPEIEITKNHNYNCLQIRLPGKKLIGTIKLPAGIEDTRWPIKEHHMALINEIEKDPVQAAVLSGKLTNCCAFCSRPLTDERSVKHGYGPICADHWNLPWDAEKDGSTKAKTKLTKDDYPF